MPGQWRDMSACVKGKWTKVMWPVTLRILGSELFYHLYVLSGADPGFPVWGGGANPRWRGCQPLTQALFGENICKNERIWSCWGGGGHVPETFVCRSATGCFFFRLWNATFILSYILYWRTIRLHLYLMLPMISVWLWKASTDFECMILYTSCAYYVCNQFV